MGFLVENSRNETLPLQMQPYHLSAFSNTFLVDPGTPPTKIRIERHDLRGFI